MNTRLEMMELLSSQITLPSGDTDISSRVDFLEDTTSETDAIPSLGKKKEEPSPKGKLSDEELIRMDIPNTKLKKTTYLQENLK